MSPSLGSDPGSEEHILPSELWAKVYAFVPLKHALWTRQVSIELAQGLNTYLQQFGSNPDVEFCLKLKLGDDTDTSEMARDKLLARLSVAKHLSGPCIQLDLSGCSITNRNTHLILNALREPSTIQSLQLLDNRLGISGIKVSPHTLCGGTRQGGSPNVTGQVTVPPHYRGGLGGGGRMCEGKNMPGKNMRGHFVRNFPPHF